MLSQDSRANVKPMKRLLRERSSYYIPTLWSLQIGAKLLFKEIESRKKAI
jgi:hypothetical protein